MATFRYVAKNQDARDVTGKIVAPDEAHVIDELRRRNLIVLDVREEGAGTVFQMSIGGDRPVKVDDVILFARQMATLIDAGIPIIQTLEALEEQAMNPSFRKIIASIKEDIHLGTSLSAAFAKHERVFDRLFVNMLRVGETGGVLAKVLDRLATYMEKSAKLKRKVGSALIYPAVIVGMALVITTVLILKVVPTFKGIYDSLNQDLPGLTQALMDFSDGFRMYFAVIVAGIMAVLGGGFLFARTSLGRRTIDGLLLRIPIFGDLISKVAISRFSRTLAVLVESGVPILESLDIVCRTIGNRVLEEVIENVIEEVKSGKSISEPLSRSRVFPSMVTRMVSVGENTGRLDWMLNKVAEFFDDQVDAAVSGLTSLIEPVIIGFLGIVIGFIVMALFLPIVNLTQAIQ
ncbi:MAG: type II secretion system F family protein [Elusimicrobia bacterium]|nr:type II secretion system F family protein [Elusimicrobiota bacterium]